MTRTQPTLSITYVDPTENFRGYLAMHGDEHRLAAGGFRVQPGLTAECLVRLAQAMKLKERLLGLAVDGAKVGIDYDPRSPGRYGAMRRFLRFLRPYLAERLSLGPDMGTNWGELEHLAHEEGMVSVKHAIALAQGLSEHDFLARIRLLDNAVGGATLGERRAGHALAEAGLAAAEMSEMAGCSIRVGIQGFGTLGRGAARSLMEAGVDIVAVSDEHCCLQAEPLDVGALLASPPGVPLSRVARSSERLVPRGEIFATPLDLLVLAACENAMNEEQVPLLSARAVVVGANLGLPQSVETLLHQQRIAVVPDFVGGCGGSASMDALFGPESAPTPEQVLRHVGARMRQLVHHVLKRSEQEGITSRRAGLDLAGTAPSPDRSSRPYGHWRPLQTRAPVGAGQRS